jgi:3-deoxy-D-manno-octulosonic-acid transferase
MSAPAAFPSLRMRVFLLAYRLIWTLFLPVGLAYLALRARKDREYLRHLPERFGLIRPCRKGAVWVHAVSIGEFRSALPLIRRLTARGHAVHVTVFTPAGRRAAQQDLAQDIAAGRASLSWVPLELAWGWRLFLHRLAPQYGLVMEVEIWPRMIASCRALGVPLMACNAQYPARSFQRDTQKTPLRAELMQGFAGALVKSDLQRQRFVAVGQANVAITGELRFDQPLPEALIAGGCALRAAWGAGRPVLVFASVVQGEEALFLDAYRLLCTSHAAAGLPRPLCIFVPRAPERFEPAAEMIKARGIAYLARSSALDAGFAPVADFTGIDLLLGDSLGEMYGYLAAADRVIVGGGYTPKGAHNISEALALGKPVWTGPHIWTIEYPAHEALEAGVLRQTAATAQGLHDALAPGAPAPASAAQIAQFFAQHSGAAEKTLAAIPQLLAQASGKARAKRVTEAQK